MFGSKNNSVGIIGLGIIGSRVAERLRNADFNVYVWNRSIKPEPNFMASPAEVAEVAQVIQIFVRDAEALVAVMEDMKEALTPDHVVLCHSTVNPWGIRRAAAIASSVGAAFLDAPFTGSRTAAEKGQLVYYIGGDAAPLDRAKKALETSGKKIVQLGKTGDATVLKIATNLISAAVVEALAEAIAITKAEGIDVSKLQEALADNANSSALLTMKLPTMAARSYAPHFSLKNMLKDARYAQAIADEKGLALPVLNASAQAMDRGVRSGQGEFDYSVVLENYAPMLRAVEERAARLKAKEAAPAPTPAPVEPTPTTETLSPEADKKTQKDEVKPGEAGKDQPAGESVTAPASPAEADKAKTATHTKLVPASVSADTAPLAKKAEDAQDKTSAEKNAETPIAKDGTAPVPESKDKDSDKEKVAPEVAVTGETAAEKKDKVEGETTLEVTKATDEKKAETETPTASGLPKPPAIAKAGLKPEAPGADKTEAAPDGKTATGTGTPPKPGDPVKPGAAAPKAEVAPVVKQPSFVSRLFRGITGRGKKDQETKSAPPVVKAFKTPDAPSPAAAKPAAPVAPGKDKEKDKDKGKDKSKEKEKDKHATPVPTGKSPGGSLAAVLSVDTTEGKAPIPAPETAALPATKLPPPPIKPVKPFRPKNPSAPATTLVAKLLSDTDVEDEDDDKDEPVAIPTLAAPLEEKEKKESISETPAANSEETTSPVVAEARPTPADSEPVSAPASEPTQAEVETAHQDEKLAVAESLADVPAEEPVGDAPAVAEVVAESEHVIEPASTVETKAEPAAQPEPEPEPEPAPEPTFDASKSLEDITREVNAKLSAFPKIPERTVVQPEGEEPAPPPAPVTPPQTRLEGTRGFIVPNLAPSPPTSATTEPAEKGKSSRKRAPSQPEKTEPEAPHEPEAAAQADREAPPQA